MRIVWVAVLAASLWGCHRESRPEETPDQEVKQQVLLLTESEGEADTARVSAGIAGEIRKILGREIDLIRQSPERPTGMNRSTLPCPENVHVLSISGNLGTASQDDPERSSTGLYSGSLVLERKYYAPAVHFLDPRESVAVEDLDLSGGPGSVIVPLAEIALPQKALAVSGIYPDDPRYPLVKEIRLTWRILPDLPGETELAEWISSLTPASGAPEIFRLSAVGDMMLQRGVENALVSGEQGIPAVFGDTYPVLRDHQLTMGNLEGAVTRGGKIVPKSYNFRFRPESLPVLAKVGFDYLSLANNHAFDYGEEGFLDTLVFLQEAGVGTSGAGKNLEIALEPWEFSDRGVRVRVYSLGAYPPEQNGFDGSRQAAAGPGSPGILWATAENVEGLSRRFTAEAFDVVMIHGGNEWSRSPSRRQMELYRGLTESGADLIIGSHPHVLQPAEVHEGRLIAYSLGNFLFAGMEEMAFAEESIILSAGIVAGRIRYLRFFPVILDGPSVRLDSGDEAIGRFLRLCAGFCSD